MTAYVMSYPPADGSTWFLGLAGAAGEIGGNVFQYPLMDRLGFWGAGPVGGHHAGQEFQYPLMDRLGFWGMQTHWRSGTLSSFSIR